eukprot:1370426-Alexandrium_andersonii.AAC.1
MAPPASTAGLGLRCGILLAATASSATSFLDSGCVCFARLPRSRHSLLLPCGLGELPASRKA